MIHVASGPVQLSTKDFETAQDVRWCPGCGDYAIFAGAEDPARTGIPREGEPRVHLRHRLLEPVPLLREHVRYAHDPRPGTGHRHRAQGRAAGARCGSSPATATGYEIGGNHLIHVMRRNVDINIILFNNRIYGLTKGQYSPTSEFGKKTKTTPLGSIDQPVQLRSRWPSAAGPPSRRAPWTPTSSTWAAS